MSFGHSVFPSELPLYGLSPFFFVVVYYIDLLQFFNILVCQSFLIFFFFTIFIVSLVDPNFEISV